jgi:ankyrin repeat protein
MWACEKSNFDSAKLLLEYGAKIEIKDSDGKIALDKAEELGLSDLAELLRQHL